MNRKVLVIDDDPAIHVLVGAHLGNWRTELCSAYDGESGLAMAGRQRPDLVLLDVDMPGLKGHEVLRRMKLNPLTRSIPVLFLSGEISSSAKVTGLDMGAVDYVAKPFDPFELRARAQSALRARQQTELSASKILVDEQTGLYNRGFFERHLRVELARARRSARPLACVIVELDAVAAEFEQAAVDEALRGAAGAMEMTCREEDIVCRYAPEQFAVLASHVDAAGIGPFVERLRMAVGSRPIAAGHSAARLGATCGWALSRFSFGRSIAAEAEDALALAKQSGGGSARVAGELAEPRLSI